MKNQFKSKSLEEYQHEVKVLITKLKTDGLESLSEQERIFIKADLKDRIKLEKDQYPATYQGKEYKGYKTRVVFRLDANEQETLAELADIDGDLRELSDLPKVKVNEQYRESFPDLAEDLEKNGLIDFVKIDDLEIIHDGLKRSILLGLDQIKALGKLLVVDRDSQCSNITCLNKKQKQLVINESYKRFMSEKALVEDPDRNKKGRNGFLITVWKRGTHSFAKEYSKRYAVSVRTIYYWVDPALYKETEKQREERKEKQALAKQRTAMQKQEVLAFEEKQLRPFREHEEIEKKAETEKQDEESKLYSTKDTSLEFLLQWLDTENPIINDLEKPKLLALKDALNKLLGVDA